MPCYRGNHVAECRITNKRRAELGNEAAWREAEQKLKALYGRICQEIGGSDFKLALMTVSPIDPERIQERRMREDNERMMNATEDA